MSWGYDGSLGVHITAIVFSAVLLISGLVFFLLAVNEQFEIHHEINLKLPPDAQFEPMLWGYGTWDRFRQLRRECIPGSPRPRRLRKFRIMGFVLFGSGILTLLTALGMLPRM
jgi:hypothetical protein